MKSSHPYKEYQANSINTADQRQLIVMLYEGALRFIQEAEGHMQSYRTFDKANIAILRAQDILTELMVSLDLEKGGEIAQNLFNLYAFVKKQLLEANIEKKTDELVSAKKILKDLATAWKELDMQAATKDLKKERPAGGFSAEG